MANEQDSGHGSEIVPRCRPARARRLGRIIAAMARPLFDGPVSAGSLVGGVLANALVTGAPC